MASQHMVEAKKKPTESSDCPTDETLGMEIRINHITTMDATNHTEKNPAEERKN